MTSYQEWFEQLRKEYGEQLAQMPLPDGVPEHVRQLMADGDEEGLIFMMKLAWQIGAQVGYSAAQHPEKVRRVAGKRVEA